MAAAASKFDFECEEDGAAATIPWIRATIYCDPVFQLGLERKALAHREHETLSRAFPFYLPARYHRMNAGEMHEKSASPGSYWTNACHFVRILNDYGTVPYYNLKMNETFPNPIKHCRWCGLVHCNEFRLCAECNDEPDYPDPTYFREVQKEAQAACHLEEHARHVIKKLGLQQKFI